MENKTSFRTFSVRCLEQTKDCLSSGFGFAVCVCDMCGCVAAQGCTDQNGIFVFCAEPCSEYRVSVYAPSEFSPGALHRWESLDTCSDGCLFFVFRREQTQIPVLREFHVTDRHYTGLPITKGEMRLCPVRLR